LDFASTLDNNLAPSGRNRSQCLGLKLSLKFGLSGKIKSPNAFAATAHALYHLAYA